MTCQPHSEVLEFGPVSVEFVLCNSFLCVVLCRSLSFHLFFFVIVHICCPSSNYIIWLLLRYLHLFLVSSCYRNAYVTLLYTYICLYAVYSKIHYWKYPNINCNIWKNTATVCIFAEAEKGEMKRQSADFKVFAILYYAGYVKIYNPQWNQYTEINRNTTCNMLAHF